MRPSFPRLVFPPSQAVSARIAAAMVVLISVLPACTSVEYPLLDCTPEANEQSIARQWNEELLDAIRRDLPSPTVHARNLFHLSAAMWDAWAVYDKDAHGVFVETKVAGSEIDPEIAIGYAAARLLIARYEDSNGAFDTKRAIEIRMEDQCLDIRDERTGGDSPAAVGNRIAAAILEQSNDDGSLEADNYVDKSYRAINAPLIVGEPGAEMVDPDRWQPLQLVGRVSQNGIPLEDEVQTFIGSQWGLVRGFALTADPRGLPIDPGPPPMFGDAAFTESVVAVITASAALDPTAGDRIDIGPGSSGNSTLGTNNGGGHSENPVTGAAYPPNLVDSGDYHRVIAEFWADGPESETPPGHWNTIANFVSDDTDLEHRIGGVGPTVDRLEWDVKMYLGLNGALHDSAIAAWGAKRTYDSVRPVSSVRYLSSLGQSSDSFGANYDQQGLPLIPGLIELITEETSTAGGRHERLSEFIGDIAVRTWTASFAPEPPSVDWIRGVEWMPYQRPTFVTPAFAAYVSGHSTFSRAAAEILTSITGSRFFPGGMGEWIIDANSLQFDVGPSSEMALQWATFYDASDQSGRSRIWGGIHIPADDIAGRLMGAQIGQNAWSTAVSYFSD